jgi:hypothetical protein
MKPPKDNGEIPTVATAFMYQSLFNFGSDDC